MDSRCKVLSGKLFEVNPKYIYETEKESAPLSRMFWWLVTFGKWGERYHYKHVKKLFVNSPPKHYMCRCSIKYTGNYV